jgi:hypothetical protein
MSKRAAYHGWKEADGKFYISVRSRFENWPRQGFATPLEAVTEASRRGLPLIWEDPAVIEKIA